MSKTSDAPNPPRKLVSGLISGVILHNALFKLDAFVTENPFIIHVCLSSHNGTVLAEIHRDAVAPEGVEELRMALHLLKTEYPRPGLRRFMLEDEMGTVVAITTAQGELLIALAERGTPTGTVLMGIGKLAAALTET